MMFRPTGTKFALALGLALLALFIQIAPSVAQDFAPSGKKVTVGGRSIPMPQGDWQEVRNWKEDSGGQPMGFATFAKVENNKLVGLIMVATSDSAHKPKAGEMVYYDRTFCRSPASYHTVVKADAGNRQDCWHFTVVTLRRGESVPEVFDDLNKWLKAKSIAMPEKFNGFNHSQVTATDSLAYLHLEENMRNLTIGGSVPIGDQWQAELAKVLGQ